MKLENLPNQHHPFCYWVLFCGTSSDYNWIVHKNPCTFYVWIWFWHSWQNFPFHVFILQHINISVDHLKCNKFKSHKFTWKDHISNKCRFSAQVCDYEKDNLSILVKSNSYVIHLQKKKKQLLNYNIFSLYHVWCWQTEKRIPRVCVNIWIWVNQVWP